MNIQKEYLLSLDGEAFTAFKQDFDQILKLLLIEMEKRETEEATINMKMTVTLNKDIERDLEVVTYEAFKDITKPTFKHEISSVMQVKNKKSGQMGGTMKMVWDRNLCQYVMREIDDGQTSLFRSDDIVIVGGELPPARTELDREAYERLKSLVGATLKVVEAMGNYTVRTKDNEVVLSSAFSPANPLYASGDILKTHVGCEIAVEVVDSDDEIPREGKWLRFLCTNCEEIIHEIRFVDDEYEYDDPEEG